MAEVRRLREERGELLNCLDTKNRDVDVAREEARLWRALAKAERAVRSSKAQRQREGYDPYPLLEARAAAEAALREAGIDPDAPEEAPAAVRPRFGEHLTKSFPDLRPWRDAVLTDPWAAALAAGDATDAEAAAVFARRCHELEERLARALEITARHVVVVGGGEGVGGGR